MKRRRLLLAAALALATVAVYARVVSFGFTALDDTLYVTKNKHVLAGLDSAGLAWAATTLHTGNWHPLTWLSLMLDAELGGSSAAVYHATNLVLHVLGTLLLFAALERMTAATARSAFVAALFALHPLHVESVAWVSERKDVLSTVFWFAGLLLYARYAERPTRGRFAWVAAAFGLGLLSKPMLVTFPFVLLLLDRWPLGRFTRGSRARLVREKLPLFLMSAASCAITLFAQTRGGAVGSLEVYPFWSRVANALESYAVYLVKTVWPSGLAVLYPHPERQLRALAVLGSVALLAVLTALALRCARTRPYVTVGWLWYAITLLPVIGLVQVGLQSRADRYTYVPLVGVFLAVAWLVPELAGRRPAALGAAAVAVLLPLCAVTWKQLGYWRDGQTLYTRLAEVVPASAPAHNSVGTMLYRERAYAEAAREFRAAIAADPKHAGARNNLALALLRERRGREALAELDEALRLKPRYAQARAQRGRALLLLGRRDEAARDFEEAIRLLPESATAHGGLAELLVERGDLEGAERHAREALRLEPALGQVHGVLGAVALLRGDAEHAIAEFSLAVEDDPALPDAHANLCGALLQGERVEEAVAECLEALRLGPRDTGARFNLGLALLRQGKPEEARRRFAEILEIDPSDARARRSLEQLGSR